MTIAYYITSHGFGHFVRSAAIIAALPAEIPLIVRTDIPEWFRAQELFGRKYETLPGGFDVGTLGADSSRVDIASTFEAATEMLERNRTRADEERRFLAERGVRVVMCDMPPFPMKIAHDEGIPTLCETNFTWLEIYGELVERCRRSGQSALEAQGRRLLETMQEEYASGDVLLIPGMALPMQACKRQMEIPLIARTGRSRRKLLCEKLGLDIEKPIYLLYLGQEGYRGIDWNRLDAIADGQFLSYQPIEGARPGLIHTLPRNLIDHADATTSVDAVIGKLGYSLCAESAANLTPIIFPPRPDFIEAEALGKAMIDFGLGVPLSAEQFERVDWADAIQQAAELKSHAKPIDCSGAQVCSSILKMAWERGSLGQLTRK